MYKKLIKELPLVVGETNAQLLIDEFIFYFYYKMDIYKITKEDILIWGVFSDPCVIKQRRWGWFGWIELINRVEIGASIDIPMCFLNIDYEKFIHNEDTITIAINERMFLEFGEGKFKAGVIYEKDS